MSQRESFEALGDRMKAIEAVESNRALPADRPFMARLDGRAFRAFIRGMTRPFHEPMSCAMIETARYLVEQTKADFAYTQSDEIMLGFGPVAPPAERLFGGRTHKLVSLLASMATARFNAEVVRTMPERAARLPVFDCRVFSMGSLEDMADCVLFRALDCRKNAITMAAAAHFGHRELMGKHSGDRLGMLHAAGCDFDALPAFFRLGSFLQRETVARELDAEELARIPPAHRPTGPVMRSRVVRRDWPAFWEIGNRAGVLFAGEAPQAHRSGGGEASVVDAVARAAQACGHGLDAHSGRAPVGLSR